MSDQQQPVEVRQLAAKGFWARDGHPWSANWEQRLDDALARVIPFLTTSRDERIEELEGELEEQKAAAGEYATELANIRAVVDSPRFESALDAVRHMKKTATAATKAGDVEHLEDAGVVEWSALLLNLEAEGWELTRAQPLSDSQGGGER